MVIFIPENAFAYVCKMATILFRPVFVDDYF